MYIVSESPAVGAYARPAAAPETPSLAKGARLDVLDVLRGIALIGMYTVHFCDYANVWDVPEGQKPALWQRFEWWFLDGRFYTMFAMLFGASCLLLIDRVDTPPTMKLVRFLRKPSMAK